MTPDRNLASAKAQETAILYHSRLEPFKKKKKKALANEASQTDFWGPASNFGIPIAAVMDTQKDPEM